WDVEILIRAAMEGTYKVAFLTIGDDRERKTKLDQFWKDLPDISRLKRQRHIKDFLSMVENQQPEKWRPYRELLENEQELERIRSRNSRSERQKIAGEWSFTQMAATISKAGIPGLDAFTAMLFGYAMSSHLVHQDADALDLIRDRVEREQERRESIELAHGARELSDLLILAMLRTWRIFISQEEPTKVIRDLYDEQRTLLDEMHGATKAWHEVEYGESFQDDY
ncbi:MAG TPA: hypothetical protein VGE04_14540, partial [Chloroflexia bacterium]